MKPRNPQGEKKQPKGDYKVGYGRPPDETRFKPGNEFGRRGGRPKGRKNDATLLKEIFDHKVEISIPGGQPQKTTMRHVMLWKLALRAATGTDTKAFNVITDYARELGVLALPPPPPPEHLAPDEAADLERFIQIVAAERGLLPPSADETAVLQDTGPVQSPAGSSGPREQPGTGDVSSSQQEHDSSASTASGPRHAYRLPGRTTVVRVDFSPTFRSSTGRKQGGASP